MSDFLRPNSEITKHGTELPHWQQGQAIQFVTFRLADSLPANKLRIWKEELAAWKQHHPEPWSADIWKEYHERFTTKFESWLDQGAGSCLFSQPPNRIVLEQVLSHDDGTRAIHHSWIIMPNHVHLLFSPLAPLEILMKTWKGISARRIGHGSIWQKNYRDTVIRDSQHFSNCVRYIRRNPKNLPPHTFTLWQSPRAQAIH
ncbi:MAG: hypothetical protein V4733_05255 [Verrucomicrobiota bacterium]